MISRENAIFPSRNCVFSSRNPDSPSRNAVFRLEKVVLSLLKPVLFRDIFMDDRLFRDVLAECLAGESDDLPATSTPGPRPFTSPKPVPFFQWQAPNLNRARSSAYTKVAAPVPPVKPLAKPAPVEPLVPIAQLKPLDQADALLFIHLGAGELREGVSLLRLKKAHRRLIKMLHPDHWGPGLASTEQRRLQEQFLQLQRAYESLSRSMVSRSANTSESACGNESASAPDCRRRDAA